LLCLLAVVIGIASGFTNGTLLPKYICGPSNDGLPKSAGALIPYLTKGFATQNYKTCPPGGGNVAIQIQTANTGAKTTATTALAPAAKYIIGACHNGNRTAAGDDVGYITPISNAILVVPKAADPVTGAGVYNIALNSEVDLALVVNTPGFNPAGIALDGAVVWAEDINQNRIGEWAAHPDTMQPWAVCNLNGKNPLVGIVHNMLVTCNPSVTGFTWKCPPTVTGGFVNFKGVGVTDAGYGTFSIQYTVTAVQFTTTPAQVRAIPANSIFAGAVVVNNGAFQPPGAIATHTIQGNVFEKETLEGTTSTAAIVGGALVGVILGGVVMGFALWVSMRQPVKRTAIDTTRMVAI